MFFHSCCCCCALAAHKEHHANTCPLNRTESSWIRLNRDDQALTCMHFLKTEPRHVTTLHLNWSYWWRKTKLLWAAALVQFSQDDALCMCWFENVNTCTCTQASLQVMINALVRVYVYCIGLRGHKAAFTITVWGFAFILETKHFKLDQRDREQVNGGRTVQQPLVFTLRYLVIKLIIGLENNLHQMDS